MIHKDTLIFDLENATHGKKPDPKKDEFRLFACYSYKTNKYYMLYDLEHVKKIIDLHKYVVGFNIEYYDNMVLARYLPEMLKDKGYGEYLINYKTNVDLMKVIKNRVGLIKTKKGLLNDILMDFRLDTITKVLDLVDDETGKETLDYSLLNESAHSWNDTTKSTIEHYAQRDIEITKKLYEWLEEYFDSFKEFLLEKDVTNKNYLTCRPATFVYKAICKKLNWPEEYQNTESGDFGGGYVSYPAGESFEGEMYCFDFNSLYPHCYMMGNLFSKSFNNDGWSGGSLFTTQGVYKTDRMGVVEELLKEFYQTRLEYKKNNDPREYTIKIIINTSYGVTGNSSFKHLYDETAAADCTSLGRQFTMYARKLLRENGYLNVYGDTDSVYILDPFKDREKVLSVIKQVVDDIKKNMNFPQDTFDMGIDDEITHMFFFKGKGKEKEDTYMDEDDFINKPKGFMKKNYIYIAKVFDDEGNWIDDKVVYKNLGVKKKSTSLITRKIFREVLISKIKEEKKVKWKRSFFENIINSFIEKDLEVVATRYSVNEMNEYKSTTSIQYQISQAYGAGIHYLIKNHRIGVGKGIKYCTVEEFKDAGMTVDDIDLSSVWSELEYFIEEEKPASLADWGL